MNYSLEEAAATVTVSGHINEKSEPSFHELFGKVKAMPAVTFKLDRVESINSLGCASWMKFVTRLQNTSKLTFQGCSIVFVQYANLVPGFIGKGVVSSVQVPYVCSKCQHHETHVIPTAQIKDGTTVDGQKCSKCASGLKMEVDPLDYFEFLGS